MASTILPVNLSVADVHSQNRDLPPADSVPEAPPVEALDNWDQEFYEMDLSVAATLGFPVVNVSGGGSRTVLVLGDSRWKDVTSDAHVYRFGVALRFIIQVIEAKADIALTLPVVAAKVSLEGARASAQLSVRGYKGPLGARLPKWDSFSVAAYGEYKAAVSEIQATMLQDEPNIVPELLGTTAAAPSIPGTDESVGLVLALDAIAHGDGLDQALRDLGGQSEFVRRIVRETYQARVGGEEKAVPSDEQRSQARGELRGLHTGFFRR